MITNFELGYLTCLFLFTLILFFGYAYRMELYNMYLRENKLTDDFKEFTLRRKYKFAINRYERLRIEDGKNK